MFGGLFLFVCLFLVIIKCIKVSSQYNTFFYIYIFILMPGVICSPVLIVFTLLILGLWVSFKKLGQQSKAVEFVFNFIFFLLKKHNFYLTIDTGNLQTWIFSALVDSHNHQQDLLTIGVTHAIKRINDRAWSLSPLI